MSGKGSSPRPFSVDTKTFESNWEKTFGKRQQEKDIPRCGCGNTQDKQGYCDGSHSRPSQSGSQENQV